MSVKSSINIDLMPKEMVFSFLARAHLINGHASSTRSLIKFTGSRSYKLFNIIPTNIEFISDHFSIKNPYSIINKNTIFPALKLFMSPYHRQYVRHVMLNGDHNNYAEPLNYFHDETCQLAYCQDCVANDVINNGFSYWHRDHSFIGIRFCHVHKEPLLILKKCQDLNHVQFPPLPAKGKVFRQPEKSLKKLLYISDQMSALINGRYTTYINHNIYNRILFDLGLMNGKYIKYIKISEITKNWLYSLSNMSAFRQLYNCLQEPDPWTDQIIQGKISTQLPLKHIIMWGALGISYHEIINYANNSYQQLQLPLEIYIDFEKIWKSEN